MKLLSVLFLALCFSTATVSFAEDHEDAATTESMSADMGGEHDMADHGDMKDAPKTHAKAHKKMAKKMGECKGMTGKKLAACKKAMETKAEHN